MKLAIPTETRDGLDAVICPHFGRAPSYVIWDEESDTIEIIDNKSNHFGGTGMPAEFLAKHSDGVICGGIGSRAISLCAQLKYKVFTGAEGTVKETIENYKKGLIKEANLGDGCGH